MPVVRDELCDSEIDLEVDGRLCGSDSSDALCSTGSRFELPNENYVLKDGFDRPNGVS
jgi:hypothetical protein